MGKAITGAAELVGALGMSTLAFFDPAVLAIPGYAQAITSLAISGLSSKPVRLRKRSPATVVRTSRPVRPLVSDR